MSSKKIIQDNPFSLMPPVSPEKRAVRNGHALVLGAARAGKTRPDGIPFRQDSRRGGEEGKS